MEVKHTGRNILLVLLAIFLLAGAFSGGLIVGWLIPGKTPLQSLPESTQSQPTQAPEATTPAVSTDLQTLFAPFWEAWDIVHEQYVDQPVDNYLLMQGAIRGMLDSLGDPHTGYLDPEEYKDATSPLVGYSGIGAYVDVSGEFLTIISPMPGSPAEAAGLRTGDQVIAVDGKDVTGTDPRVVLNSVRGPEGTDVTLTIKRENVTEPLEFTLTRATIIVPTIESKMLDDQIAYISINQFAVDTTADLKKALKELLAQEPVGLILDLRNNTGGFLDTAIEVISQFIASGTVMIEQSGDGKETTYEALRGGLATEIPLVVLVNEWSASASEITAGAIQDYGRGKLVGTVTYGKGSVQNWVPLNNDQGAVKVTIARWLTPKGRQINGVGLTPDVVVEITEEDATAEIDTQLQAAINILLGKD